MGWVNFQKKGPYSLILRPLLREMPPTWDFTLHENFIIFENIFWLFVCLENLQLCNLVWSIIVYSFGSSSIKSPRMHQQFEKRASTSSKKVYWLEFSTSNSWFYQGLQC
jgi:hypothetical protein